MTCKGYGLYAGNQYFICSDKHLLVLLPVVPGMGYQYRGSR